MILRILTAIIALIIFVPFVIYGKWPFVLFIYVLATIGLMELVNMQQGKKYTLPAVTAIIALWALLFPGLEKKLPYIHVTKTTVVIVFSMVLLIYTVLLKGPFTFHHAGFFLMATAYIATGFYFFMHTREVGLDYLLYALFIVWATDTGAYFIGKSFGRRKLIPRISPNKTVEGALGGILSACLVAIVFQLIKPFPVSFIMIIAITVFLSIVGQLGDLIESAFKRYFAVKDSGAILPGHGGILDRFDSLLLVLPALYVIGFT